MSSIEPGKSYTFTINAVPKREAQMKTIRRLMRMQADIQKGLTRLARRRRQSDNVTYIRAGRPWTHRARTTKLTYVAAGESFTIRVSPQIIPDIRSVEQFLDVKSA